VRSIAALVAFLVTVSVACSPVTPSDPLSPSGPPSLAPSRAPSASPASPASDAAPPWILALETQLQCEGPPQSTGGELGEIGLEGGGPTPQSALDAFLGTGMWASFPAGGFEDAFVVGQWARHVYVVEGRVRALAISTSAETVEHADGSWAVAAIRACDPSEFDPDDGLTFDVLLWRDATGKLARTDLIRAIRGPAHCGYESSTWLRFEEHQYFRDPNGVMAGQSVVPFHPDVPMPSDAVDTGFHTDAWHLFTVPDGDALYVRTTDGAVERWGRSRDPGIGCA
jgi:hypothetical protein